MERYFVNPRVQVNHLTGPGVGVAPPRRGRCAVQLDIAVPAVGSDTWYHAIGLHFNALRGDTVELRTSRRPMLPPGDSGENVPPFSRVFQIGVCLTVAVDQAIPQGVVAAFKAGVREQVRLSAKRRDKQHRQ